MYVYSNNADSTLDGAISLGATSFNIQSADTGLFPDLTGDNFTYLTLGDDILNEVVKCTASSGTTITCDATTSAWSDTTDVKLLFCAEAYDEAVKTDGLAKRIELKDYAETKTAPTSASNVLILDLENGNVFEVELTEAITTLTISNPPITGKGGSFTLILKQDSTGSYAVTWPASIKWASGSGPTLTTDANAVDILVFMTTDAGTTWYGMLAGANFS